MRIVAYFLYLFVITVHCYTCFWTRATELERSSHFDRSKQRCSGGTEKGGSFALSVLLWKADRTLLLLNCRIFSNIITMNLGIRITLIIVKHKYVQYICNKKETECRYDLTLPSRRVLQTYCDINRWNATWFVDVMSLPQEKSPL